MSERPWTDQMRALVRLLGLMRREGRTGRKTVQLAMRWLREKGVDPDAELALVSGDNSVHAGRDVRSDGPKPVCSRRRRRQADGEGGATLF